MATLAQDDLFPQLRNPEGTCFINDRCLLRTQEGHCVVLVSGIVLAQYALTDRMAQAHAMVSLVEQGWANQVEVARAFKCSVRTVRRQQRRFEEGGLVALGRGRGYPRGRARVAAWRRRLVQRLKSKGYGQREIARQLGVTENAVRKLLRRLGGTAASPVQTQLAFSQERTVQSNRANSAPVAGSPPPPTPTAAAHPKLSARGSAANDLPPPSTDTDPGHRWEDRLLARLGLLDDAAPLFGPATAVPRAGVLLAVPALVASGSFECAQKIYGTLGPAFYGLRTSLLTLLLMALWRIKRPEGLKEHSPQDLGRVLGLDRAPEVKTLRRKLTSLAAAGRAAQFGQALAEQRVALRGAALGFLYVDGHVRV